MTKYSGKPNLLRHEAAILSAELATVNQRQAYKDAKACLATAKTAYEKDYEHAYFKAFEALKDKRAEKDFNAAYGEHVAHAKADFDKAYDALRDK